MCGLDGQEYRITKVAERRSPWELKADVFGTDWPRVDIDETDEEIRITAELPGVEKDDIDISMTDDRVTIRGEKKEQAEKKGRGYRGLKVIAGIEMQEIRVFPHSPLVLGWVGFCLKPAAEVRY